MKCSNCRFYIRSKVYGNSCSCRGLKPCEIERKEKYDKARKARKDKRRDKKWK